MVLQERYDYLITGAGSAGCVLARRLSDAGNKVLLIEAGMNDKSWILRMPAGLRSTFKPSSKYNYWFKSTKQKYLDNREIDQPRGKVLGGSSSINGMTWLRGHPLDYNRWEEQGAKGWAWEECFDYFKKIESSEINDGYRGQTGFIKAQRYENLSPLNLAFIEAGIEAGFKKSEDVNGFQQEGVSRFEMSVDNGIRNSASYGYLHSQRDNSNLTILLNAQTEKILIKNSIAEGLVVKHRGHSTHIFATKEVLISAGVFGSPQLLMLSGIGPKAHLQDKGIETLVDLPAVGENLQDHLECHIQIETKEPVSLNKELQPHRILMAGLKWFGFKKGVASVNQCHVGAFLKSEESISHADIQFHFFPLFFDKNWIPQPTTYGYRLGVGPMRPSSRGHVKLRSLNIEDQPLIEPNYMSTQKDWEIMRRAMRLGHQLLSQEAFKKFHYREDTPAIDMNDDNELDDFIRKDASSAYHPCGTCKMGHESDTSAVVSPELKVKGLGNLRIVDASVIPSLPSANINATTIMIAEKASDIILKTKTIKSQILPFV